MFKCQNCIIIVNVEWLLVVGRSGIVILGVAERSGATLPLLLQQQPHNTTINRGRWCWYFIIIVKVFVTGIIRWMMVLRLLLALMPLYESVFSFQSVIVTLLLRRTHRRRDRWRYFQYWFDEDGADLLSIKHQYILHLVVEWAHCDVFYSSYSHCNNSIRLHDTVSDEIPFDIIW